MQSDVLICYAYRDNVIKVLRGVDTDDSLFGIIYTLDDKEEWDNPKMWVKANPNLGVSLSVDYLADQVKDAKNRPEAVRNVMTKNVNLWVDAELSAIPAIPAAARRLASLESFIDYYLEMCDLYNSFTEAYERLEEFHTAVTGHRRYAEFDTFRRTRRRYLDSCSKLNPS